MLKKFRSINDFQNRSHADFDLLNFRAERCPRVSHPTLKSRDFDLQDSTTKRVIHQVSVPPHSFKSALSHRLLHHVLADVPVAYPLLELSELLDQERWLGNGLPYYQRNSHRLDTRRSVLQWRYDARRL